MNLLTPFKKFGLVSMLALIAATSAHAGTDTTFDTILNLVVGWAEGSLGKLLSISAFIIGMGIGLVRQSVMAIVLGLAFALVMFYGPALINSLATFAV
jgi:conjugal transfer pilus assembly protein TraA